MEKEKDTRFEDVHTDKGTTEHGGSTRYANSEAGIAHVEANKTEEKRLLRKLDAVILPLTALLYLSVSVLGDVHL
jgi:hypothetical protein